MAKTKGSKWGAKLKSMSAGWKESEDRYNEIFGGRDIPDDTYLVKLQDIFLDELGEHTIIKREHVVIEGEHKGIVLRDNLFLSNDTGCAFARRYLKMVGVDVPEKIEDLEDTLVNLKELAPICKVRVKTDAKGYKNVDVVSVVDDDDDDDDSTTQDVDLETMDKTDLRVFVKDNDIEIENYRKMDEDTLRKAIAEAIGNTGDGKDNDDDSGSVAVDFDEMDLDEMKEFVEENDIDPVDDLGFKNAIKYKKVSEDDLREALETYVKSMNNSNSSEEDDELLEEAKVFCGSWDIDIDDGADLDDIKSAIEKRGTKKPFPQKELDEDEILVLGKFGFSNLIKAKAKAKK